VSATPEPTHPDRETGSLPARGSTSAPAPGAPPGISVSTSSDSDQFSVWLRVGAALAALLSAGGAFLSWFSGVVVFTGCFIKCDPADADPIGGTLLFLLAGVLFVVAALGTQLAVTGSTRQSRTTALAASTAAGAAVVLTVLNT
jgi:hypothetical protein